MGWDAKRGYGQYEARHLESSVDFTCIAVDTEVFLNGGNVLRQNNVDECLDITI